jgi:hypothetical protein
MAKASVLAYKFNYYRPILMTKSKCWPIKVIQYSDATHRPIGIGLYLFCRRLYVVQIAPCMSDSLKDYRIKHDYQRSQASIQLCLSGQRTEEQDNRVFFKLLKLRIVSHQWR